MSIGAPRFPSVFVGAGCAPVAGGVPLYMVLIGLACGGGRRPRSGRTAASSRKRREAYCADRRYGSRCGRSAGRRCDRLAGRVRCPARGRGRPVRLNPLRKRAAALMATLHFLNALKIAIYAKPCPILWSAIPKALGWNPRFIQPASTPFGCTRSATFGGESLTSMDGRLPACAHRHAIVRQAAGGQSTRAATIRSCFPSWRPSSRPAPPLTAVSSWPRYPQERMSL